MSTNKNFSAITAQAKKLPWLPICLILLVIIFFSIRLIITYDSAHYLNYVSIFEGNLPASSWDIVRGPVFPAIIFLFDTIFGKTGTGILVGIFIFYLIFAITCYCTCKEICKHYKHKTLITNILLTVLILNPLIMGYFHVLLTEFIAITFTLLNILLAYKWLHCDTHSKKQLIFYSIYFIFSVIFCYHLKQSYIIVAFIPLITATIISIVRQHTKKNILYRSGTLLLSLFFFFTSLIAWNTILQRMGVDMDTGRDSSSMLSQQLLKAYQITYDQDSDGKNDPLSTMDAIGVLFRDFISNPTHITSTYVRNYCGLTSVCVISSDDTVDYISTFDFNGLETFENTTIGYRPYSVSPSIFEMTDSLYSNASIYGDSTNRSLIAKIMVLFKGPANLLFKLSLILCLPSIIVLIIFRIKYKNPKHSALFALSLILLITAFLHLAFSAGIGLIIDRYAIEAFVPSVLGIFSTGTYCYFTKFHSTNSPHHKTFTKKELKHA